MIYAYIHIYRVCTRARICTREPPTFPEPAFPEMDRGRILLLWIGVALVFPENGWIGVGLVSGETFPDFCIVNTFKELFSITNVNNKISV